MKVVFFDIDGTLTETISGALSKQSPDDIKIMDGVTKGLDFHKSRGYTLIGISNQGVCAATNQSTGKPYKSIEDTIKEMQNTLELLPQLEYICFCPDFEGQIMWKVSKNDVVEIKQDDTYKFDSFRTPGAGIINFFRNQNAPQEAWLVGDRPEDDAAANNAGIDFIWASTWRQRFSPGFNEFTPTSIKQVEFLEGIKL